MTRAELVDVMARGICPTFYVTPWEQTSEFRQGLCRDMATAALAAIEAAGFVCVPRKLLTEARACMRATGWHLAIDAPDSASDGVLEAACSEVEERFRAALEQEGKP